MHFFNTHAIPYNELPVYQRKPARCKCGLAEGPTLAEIEAFQEQTRRLWEKYPYDMHHGMVIFYNADSGELGLQVGEEPGYDNVTGEKIAPDEYADTYYAENFSTDADFPIPLEYDVAHRNLDVSREELLKIVQQETKVVFQRIHDYIENWYAVRLGNSK